MSLAGLVVDRNSASDPHFIFRQGMYFTQTQDAGGQTVKFIAILVQGLCTEYLRTNQQTFPKKLIKNVVKVISVPLSNQPLSIQNRLCAKAA